MKGTLFEQPLEFQLNVDGESWGQGDKVAGQLSIKNHGNENLNLSELGVSLAYGDSKKIKKGDPEAFKEIEVVNFANEELSSQGSQDLEWGFSLSEDCPITDKTGSYYLLYGKERGKGSGQLQLTVTPKKSIEQFLEIFENFHRFKVKEKKSKKGWIEVKMLSPASKDYSSVEGLLLSMRIVEKKLELKYEFKMKKLNYGGGGDLHSVKVEKNKAKFEQVLLPQQYTFYGDSPNQDGILKALEEVLEKVKFKSF